MDELEQIMKDVEKRERTAERYLRTTKRISLLRKLAHKIAALRLQFLLDLYFRVSDFIELQYSKIYEIYYQYRYRRTIQRFQLLAGVAEKPKPQDDEEDYAYRTSPIGNDLIDFYYHEVQKKAAKKESN